MKKPKIAFVVAVPMTAKSFLLGHFQELSKFFDITLVSNFDLHASMVPSDYHVKSVVHVPISRKINVVNDISSLLTLYNFFRKNDFLVVHSVTPKAGLLTMLASKAACVQYRVHTFTGQVWATKSGLARKFLGLLDKLVFLCSSEVTVDSPSQRIFLLQEKIVSKHKSHVLGEGSISGVNISRFKRNSADRDTIRNKFKISDNSMVFLFLGRLCKEKGLDELLAAYSLIKKTHSNIFLMIVGPNEEKYDDDFFSDYSDINVIVVGGTNTPEKYFSAADIFVLPSHREGFGTVIIEAAASGLPSIGSNIYGLSDAIIDGKTGLLHKVNNIQDLTLKLEYALDNPVRIKEMGLASEERAVKHFSSQKSSELLYEFYKKYVV